MNINELNAKLVSELREIARLIGIPDADKLRKQELVSKIIATGEDEAKLQANKQEEDTVSVNEANVPEDKPRKRARTVSAVKTTDSVSVRNTREDQGGSGDA